MKLYLVADKDDGHIFANPGEVLMPLRYIFIGDSRGNIEHNDSTMSTDALIKKCTSSPL